MNQYKVISSTILPCLFPPLAVAELTPAVELNELENHIQEGDNVQVWNGDFSLSQGRHSLVFHTEGERADEGEEYQIRLAHAIELTSNWGMQWGWRGDFGGDENPDWFLLGANHEIAYGIEAELIGYFNSDQNEFEFSLSKDFDLTDALSFSPELKFFAYTESDEAEGVFSGVTDMEAAARLRYHLNENLAPYVGVLHVRALGDAADYADLQGEDSSTTTLLIGISIEF